MGRWNVFAFLSSFILGTLSLVFGSRALIEYYDLFPPDPYSDDPLTWRNVLHNAWGVRRKSLLEQQLENDPEFLKKYTVTMDDMKLPIAIVVVLSCTVLVAFFALGKKASQKPVLSPDTWQEFILVEKTAISPNTAIYKFSLPNSNDILGLPIGRHISIQAEINGKNIMRSYTPISSDDDRGHFKLLVKAYEKGNISRYLSLLTLGQTVRVKGPKGQFKYEPGLVTHLGMIAGGTGITPMLQIIRAIMKNPKDKTKVSLIYANVGFEDILLKSELDELANMHPKRFEVYYVLNIPPAQGWNGGVGFVTKDMIAKHIPAPESTMKLLMCGPPPMMEVMKKYAVELGFEQPRTVSKLVDQTFVF